MEEFGSYDWYSKLQDPFYQHMVQAINHADGPNMDLLVNAVPNMDGWDRRPFSCTDIDINDDVKYIEREAPSELKCVSGSFNWYRFRSGHFVTYMTKVIMHADGEMKQRIYKAFPQMVAAFELDNWDMSPIGFISPSYDSIPSEQA